MDIKKCNKFGSGWYRFDRISHFEYNPHATEEQATAFGDISKRMPIGSVSMNIGNIVRAVIFEYRWSDISECYSPQWKCQKSFCSKKYGSELDAFKAGSDWVMNHCISENNDGQMDLFPEFAKQAI